MAPHYQRDISRLNPSFRDAFRFEDGDRRLFATDRKVLDSLLQFEERSRVVFALVAWTGFDQAVVDYDRRARVAGRSGWGLSRMIKSMYDVFIGFSFVPVRLMTVAGITMFLL